MATHRSLKLSGLQLSEHQNATKETVLHLSLSLCLLLSLSFDSFYLLSLPSDIHDCLLIVFCRITSYPRSIAH